MLGFEVGGLTHALSHFKLDEGIVVGSNDRLPVHWNDELAKTLADFSRNIPPTSSEKVIGTDQRTAPSTNEYSLYPWISIARIAIDAPFGGSCWGTGWLAGPETIITAGQLLYDVDLPNATGTAGWAKDAAVKIGYNNGQYVLATQATKFRVASVWKGYIDGSPDDTRREQIDIGCIQLDKPFADLGVFFNLLDMPDAALLH